MEVRTRIQLKASLVLLLLISCLGSLDQAWANPAFARQYSMSCAACHAAYPRLNAFGKQFQADNMRMAGWKETVGVDTGDPDLVLPKIPPIGFRVQAYMQARKTDVLDDNGNKVAEGELDMQAPYLIKMFSAAPLSDELSYYFYAMMAEKGANGTILVEDAWLQHSDLFGSGVSLTAGQFQLSDLMFPRETRLTFQDFIPYRMADITYQRGAFLSKGVGPLSLTAGAVNGNGIEANQKLNSGGYQRPDRAFDDNRNKVFFAHAGVDLAAANVGVFATQGYRADLGDTQVLGLNFSGDMAQRWFWFGQLLLTEWSDVRDNGVTLKDATWNGGFLGLDYVRDNRWTYSLLYNFADANDLDNSGTIYEGINLNSLTAAASYYLQRNLKVIVEYNADLLAVDDQVDGIGHDTKEDYLLLGVDMGF